MSLHYDHFLYPWELAVQAKKIQDVENLYKLSAGMVILTLVCKHLLPPSESTYYEAKIGLGLKN